jgi:hypothetical protein
MVTEKLIVINDNVSIYIRVCIYVMYILIYSFTLWLFNIAMENGPFIDGLPIRNGGSFHGKLLNNQRVLKETWFSPGLVGNVGIILFSTRRR